VKGQRLTVAFVGCGYIADVHLSALANVRQARLVALCDEDLGRAERLSENCPGASLYRDVGQMLQEEKPDVVHVLTPVDTHATVAIAALRAGAHVLVEKPMAVDAQAAGEMISAASENQRTLCVDHNRLFDPVMERARLAIEQGAVGRVVGADAWQGFDLREPGNPFEKPDHWTHKLPGGVAQNLAPHPVYLLQAVIGKARKVMVGRARLGIIPKAATEEYRALIEGEKATGSVSMSLTARPFATTLTIYGSEATLILNFGNQTLLFRRPPRGPKLVAKAWENLDTAVQLVLETGRTAWAVARKQLRLYPGLRLLVKRFYEGLEVGEAPPVTGNDGLATVEILDALWAEKESRSSEQRLLTG